jgi:radical SAM protein with 4Fe4S-binding SPASM domain
MNRSKVYDILRFFSKLTFRRLWNMALVYAGFYLKKNWGMPFAFAIEPTTSCNLRCPECPSGLRSFSRNTGNLKIENFEKYIQEYQKNAVYLTLYFQGEPYLNADFLQMVSLANQKKLYVTTSTNAHYLTPEKANETVKSGLDRLIISVDGTTQETYSQYRVGGSLDKVKEGIKNMVDAKREKKSQTPYLILQFLVFAQNEHQIPEIQQLAKDYGLDELQLKTAQVYDFENGNDLIPKDLTHSRYSKTDDGKYQLKYHLNNECWKMWHSNVVTWDGNVVPCCFDKDAKYMMGNLHQNSLKEIWGNSDYQIFRAKLLTDRTQIDICKNCTEGLD